MLGDIFRQRCVYYICGCESSILVATSPITVAKCFVIICVVVMMRTIELCSIIVIFIIEYIMNVFTCRS